MTTIKESRDKDRARPVYLVEISLLNGGPTLYLSDRNITVGSQAYEDYIEEIKGEKEGAAVIFRNERFRDVLHLVELGESFPFEGASVTIKEAYLDDAGDVSETETVFSGISGGPQEINLKTFTCSVSGMGHKADNSI